MSRSTKPVSLYHEGWTAFKASKNVWFLWVIAYGIVFGFVSFQLEHWQSGQAIYTQVRQNPTMLNQHPEMLHAYLYGMFMPLSISTPILLIFNALLAYAVTVGYLRLNMRNNPPEFGIEHFMYWLRTVAWKYVRPCLWLLLPVIGVFFYWRSLVYSSLASPLAALQRSPELERSWTLTEGNWWRIFWAEVKIGVVISLWAFLIVLAPSILMGALSFMTNGAEPSGAQQTLRAVISLLQGMFAGATFAAQSIFACTTYRVLLKEEKAENPSLPLTNPASI